MGDQGKITQILADLETEITSFNTQFTELKTTSEKQLGEIESLQKTNMNLFLRVGNPVPEQPLNNEKTMTYEDLLNSWDSKGV